MDMVRDALGEDAIIVATREDKASDGKDQVHLTAAIESDNFENTQNTPTADGWLYEEDSDEAQVVEALTDSLLHHAVPEEILDQIISYASVMDHPEPRLALLSAIENLYKFFNLPTAPMSSKTPHSIMMVGPPGAGKTLAAAKIAARGVMNGINISVITTDTERAGGREQLEAFTNLMDIELQLAPTPLKLKELIEAPHNKNADQIIIDTSGANPFDPDHIKRLAYFCSEIETEPVLVLPTGYDAEEAGEIAKIFASLGAKMLLSTRIDVARRIGSILSAAYYGGMALTDIGTSAKVAGGLSHLNAKRLTQLLMPRAEGAKIVKSQSKDSQVISSTPKSTADNPPEFFKSLDKVVG